MVLPALPLQPIPQDFAGSGKASHASEHRWHFYGTNRRRSPGSRRPYTRHAL